MSITNNPSLEEIHDWYNNPETLAFCEERGIMPPPYWNPTGTSGEWYWEEDVSKMPKPKTLVRSVMSKKTTTSLSRADRSKGMWMWREDAKPFPFEPKTVKPWYKRLLGL